MNSNASSCGLLNSKKKKDSTERSLMISVLTQFLVRTTWEDRNNKNNRKLKYLIRNLKAMQAFKHNQNIY